MVCQSKAAPAARDSRLGINNHIGFGDSGGDRRNDREERRRRIAARVRDQLSAGNLLAADLRQAVDRVGEEIRAGRVYSIPTLILCGVVEAEVGGDVHHGNPAVDEGQQRLGTRLVGQPGEDKLDVVGQFRDDRHVEPRQALKNVRERFPSLAPARNGMDGHPRMVGEQAR
ncbi:MAG: hypothetical protein KatS3mg060_3355 [Dehalococcoidia bacterium]|nr:MAG: hypothetical protein KatS3mg060_3355 [Dehalococcoidia bacterium]